MQHLCTRKKKIVQRCTCFSVRFSKSYKRCKSVQGMHYSTVAQCHIALHNSRCQYILYSSMRYITVAVKILYKQLRHIFSELCCNQYKIHIFSELYCASLYSCNVQHSFEIFSEQKLHCTSTEMLHFCIRAMYNTVLGLIN